MLNIKIFNLWMNKLFIKIYCIYCSRLFSLIKCNSKSIILTQKNQDIPIIFYTESHLEHSAGVSEKRFFLFTISEDKLHFNFSNAPLNSIHSINEFSLFDHCPLSKVKTYLFTVNDYYSSSTTISFTNTLIHEFLNISVTPKNLTNYSHINFNADDWFMERTFYNSENIPLDWNKCRVVCTENNAIITLVY